MNEQGRAGARIPLMAANWKMNTTVAEGVALASAVRALLDGEMGVEIVLCPPFTHLVSVRECLSGSSIFLGAQTMFWEQKGAYTGEVSADMLRGIVSHVIVGHSERRTYFGETDDSVNRKLKAALAVGLVPIVCVGETGEQRGAGQTEAVLRRQVLGGLDAVEPRDDLIVAYEPVWAIGTGVSAQGEQAQDAIAFIRAQVRSLLGSAGDATRILYGGSVTPANIAEFMSQPDVDGALVGGASLIADSFAGIVRGGRV